MTGRSSRCVRSRTSRLRRRADRVGGLGGPDAARRCVRAARGRSPRSVPRTGLRRRPSRPRTPPRIERYRPRSVAPRRPRPRPAGASPEDGHRPLVERPAHALDERASVRALRSRAPGRTRPTSRRRHARPDRRRSPRRSASRRERRGASARSRSPWTASIAASWQPGRPSPWPYSAATYRARPDRSGPRSGRCSGRSARDGPSRPDRCRDAEAPAFRPGDRPEVRVRDGRRRLGHGVERAGRARPCSAWVRCATARARRSSRAGSVGAPMASAIVPGAGGPDRSAGATISVPSTDRQERQVAGSQRSHIAGETSEPPRQPPPWYIAPYPNVRYEPGPAVRVRAHAQTRDPGPGDDVLTWKPVSRQVDHEPAAVALDDRPHPELTRRLGQVVLIAVHGQAEVRTMMFPPLVPSRPPMADDGAQAAVARRAMQTALAGDLLGGQDVPARPAVQLVVDADVGDAAGLVLPDRARHAAVAGCAAADGRVRPAPPASRARASTRPPSVAIHAWPTSASGPVVGRDEPVIPATLATAAHQPRIGPCTATHPGQPGASPDPSPAPGPHVPFAAQRPTYTVAVGAASSERRPAARPARAGIGGQRARQRADGGARRDDGPSASPRSRRTGGSGRAPRVRHRHARPTSRPDARRPPRCAARPGPRP